MAKPYLGRLPLFLKTFHVHLQAFLFRNEAGQIHRETVSIVEQPRSVSWRRKRIAEELNPPHSF